MGVEMARAYVTIEADASHLASGIQGGMSSAESSIGQFVAKANESFNRIDANRKLSNVNAPVSATGPTIPGIVRSPATTPMTIDSSGITTAVQGGMASARDSVNRFVESSKAFVSSLSPTFGNSFSSIGQKAKSTFSSVQEMTSGFAGKMNGILGTIGVGFGLMSLINSFRESVGLAEIQIDAEQRLDAVLRATGNAAGFASEELKQYASEMQSRTTFGDEGILNAMSKMLTFKSITGDIFKSAMGLSADLAATGFGNMETAVVMMGKALEDPLIGMNAMRRVGVTISEAEKERIKTLMAQNRLHDAQQIILQAVRGQMGGVAEKMSQTPIGRMKQLQNVLGDVKEEMGKLWVPVRTFVLEVQIAFNKALVVIGGWVSSASEIMGGLPIKIGLVVGAMGGVIIAVSMVKKQLAFLGAVNPFTRTLMIASSLIGIVVTLADQFLKTEKGQNTLSSAAETLGKAWSNVKTALSGLWEGVKMVFSGFGISIDDIRDSFGGFVSSVIGKVSEMALSLSAKMVEWAPYIVAGLSIVRDFASSVAEFFRAVWDVAINWVQSIWASFSSYVSGIFGSIGKSSSWLGSIFSGSLAEAFKTVLANLNVMLGSWQGFREGIVQIVSQAVLAFQALWEQAKNFVNVKLLQIKGFFLDVWSSISESSVRNMMPTFAKFFMWIRKKSTELSGQKWLLSPEQESSIIAEDQARALDAIRGQRLENQQAIASAIESQEKDHQNRMAEIGSESLELSKKWKERMGELPTLSGNFQSSLEKAKDAMKGIPAMPKIPEKPEVKKSKKPSAEAAAAMGKEAEALIGRMAFSDLGKKLQEQMMKQSETTETNSLLQKQVGLNERGVQVQEQMLATMKGGSQGGLAP